ncbi:homoserine kinase [Arthrobacter sp.]|uniref:homoserine kinase n=1 Tax=Arthrobacter sp. TaxID=1667 RepID=UPI003A92CCCC
MTARTPAGFPVPQAPIAGPCIAPGQSVTVLVPATTANLGPGYDCLGMALGLHDTLTVTTTSETGVHVDIDGEGAGCLPTDASHLVARTILTRWSDAGAAPAGLRLHARNVIPHGRGLGSSAAAIVSALTAADALLPEDLRRDMEARESVFAAAARLEGHPDNVAPAVFGSLTLSMQDDAGATSTALALDERIVPVVAVPDVELSTRTARSLLPDTVPHAVAAANGARVGLLVHALAMDPSLLLAATEDRLHQDHRAPAMPASAALIARLRAAGHAAVVSGAGPTVLVLAASTDEAREVSELIAGQPAAGTPGTDGDAAVSWRVLMPGVDRDGARLEAH